VLKIRHYAKPQNVGNKQKDKDTDNPIVLNTEKNLKFIETRDNTLSD